MKIRIKWENGQWWAYFNGNSESHMHAEILSDMCKAISVCWPKKEHAASKYVYPHQP